MAFVFEQKRSIWEQDWEKLNQGKDIGTNINERSQQDIGKIYKYWRVSKRNKFIKLAYQM